MKIGVIGSGISGLVVSIRLAARGASVTVFEKNKVPGGKIAEIRNEGFRFDTGPSLFTLPQLAQELFTLAGERMQDWIPYRSLTSNCLYFSPMAAGSTFTRIKKNS
ncbi:MAG: FAD-dependent oxidoreductase [Bacteroides sp.]|nr:FAD-dependent oxidoreductase [Bacteroides sp.]